MFFKLVHKNEIHVLKSEANLTMEGLKSFIRTVFKSLPSQFTLTYKDSDGDNISIVTEEDLTNLLSSEMTKVRV